MDAAPDDEIPRRAVPQASEEHREDEIEIRARLAAAVSAERDVEVFAQPGGERDVPAPPEVGDGFGAVRSVEIFREDEAEHEAESDRHVGVAAEVEVDLERVARHADPCFERAARERVECGVGDLSARVREEDFFCQPHEEERGAAREFFTRERALAELFGEEGELQDRSGDEVREHRDEAGEINEVGHRLRVAAIHVNDVAERLKRVEADAERQHDAQRGIPLQMAEAERAEERIERIEAEVEVFEKAEREEIADDGAEQRAPLRGAARGFRIERRRVLSPRPPHAPVVVRDHEAEQPV